MDVEERIELICRPPTEEVLTIEDLKRLMEIGVPLKHYIGFEVSGFVHIGTGIVSMQKIADFQKAGVNCTIFLADWHSWINDKLGGDLEVIRKVAGGYFKEAMKASLKAVGGNPDKVSFVLGSELYHHNDEYWQCLIEISKNVSLSRIRKSITIMGRREAESVNFAQLIYPPMQVADIFSLRVNLPHAGTDQRKAHVIAREVALKLKTLGLYFEEDGEKKLYKPVAVHHHLILGLVKPEKQILDEKQAKELWSTYKMSKSLPYTSIFIHDSPEEIKRKILACFCPEKNIEFNPMLDWVKHIVFRGEETCFQICRPAKYGGEIECWSYGEIEKRYREGKLHPLDLKNDVADYLSKLLEPVRRHFENPSAKKTLEELREMRVTR